ncbi:hypothetical protein KEJ18_05055 [Candidatus Bathyarchaeota archaeon]|nr:hypothetical protein [Candidatus Bathyarchaeota archaeon]
MVFYVTYIPPHNLDARSEIENQLKTLGCKRIRGSFWVIGKKSLTMSGRILQGFSPTLLRRIREVRKPVSTKDGEQRELGSLIIIAYQSPDGVARVKARNWLRRAPCIRLCPGVCAFPHKHFHDQTGRLMNAGSFWEHVREFDENAVIIPRLVVVNSRAVDRLLAATEHRVIREVESIIKGYKSLIQKIEQDEIDKIRSVKIVRSLRRRFIIVKKVSAFYDEWLKLNLSTTVMKPYPTIRKSRYLFEEKYGSSSW